MLFRSVTHAFAMIAHVEPSFNLKCLKDDLPPAEAASLEGSVWEEASAFAEKFVPEEARGTRADGDTCPDVGAGGGS